MIRTNAENVLELESIKLTRAQTELLNKIISSGKALSYCSVYQSYTLNGESINQKTASNLIYKLHYIYTKQGIEPVIKRTGGGWTPTLFSFCSPVQALLLADYQYKEAKRKCKVISKSFPDLKIHVEYGPICQVAQWGLVVEYSPLETSIFHSSTSVDDIARIICIELEKIEENETMKASASTEKLIEFLGRPSDTNNALNELHNEQLITEENSTMRATYNSELDNDLNEDLNNEFEHLTGVRMMRHNVLAPVEELQTDKGFKSLVLEQALKFQNNTTDVLKRAFELVEHTTPAYNYYACFPDLKNLADIPQALRTDLIMCYSEEKSFSFKIGCSNKATAAHLFNKYSGVA
jgi:hypothetical protein